MKSGWRSGVYVDAENISRTGGRGMRFEVLRDFACRDGADALRLNAYLAFDQERARQDQNYRDRATRYHFALRAAGFKVIEKPVQWFVNEDGVRVSKANSDLELAVDLLLQSAKLDRVVLVTGDGDFIQVVRALQNLGCRVELLAFENVSYRLRCECDLFVSGYLIPGLLPAKTGEWGELGSRVRGTAYHYNSEKGFGFFRFLVNLNRIHLTDTQEDGGAYRNVYFHRSNCSPNIDLTQFPSRDVICEFTLSPGRKPGELEAKEIELVYSYGR